MLFRDKKAKFNETPIVDPLEPRVLYSADPVGLLSGLLTTALDSYHPDSNNPFPISSIKNVDFSALAYPWSKIGTAQESPVDTDYSIDLPLASGEEEPQRNEIIFIDAGVSDLDVLLADIHLQDDPATKTHIHVLAADSDGVKQVSDILERYQNLDAVHFFSHGDAGHIQLGNGVLSNDKVGVYADQLTQWSNSLAANADLLFYGCNLASSSAGLSLINAVSQYTGSDVAASDDLTGHANKSGDWELEFEVGEINTDTPLSVELQQKWENTLELINVTTFDDVADGGDTSSIDNLRATPGTNGISLREAIIASNNDDGQADTIVLQEGTYTLDISGASDNNSAAGDLDILDSLTITGAGADKTIISGADSYRVFHVLEGAGGAVIEVTISDLKIEGGFTSETNNNNGAGLDVENLPSGSSVTVKNVWFSANNTTGILDFGGAIGNQGNLIIEDSLIEGNSSGSGGGIANYFSGTLSMTNVTLSGNTATGGNGGGLYNSATANLNNVTIAYNDANVSGGGVHSPDLVSTETTITNTLIANNTAGSNSDADGVFISALGDNLIESPGSATGLHTDDITGIDPNLGALHDNNGPTQTHALLRGSSAIDAGSSAGSPVADQRGAQRDALVDIGAFEVPNDHVALMLSSVGDVTSPSGVPGLDAWTGGEIIKFGSPDFTVNPGITGGTLYSVFQIDDFVADSNARVDALHYVSADITVAGFDLFQGDVIFSVASDDIISGVTYKKEDVVVFHPDTPGDYSSGTFALLIDTSDISGTIPNEIRGITLVEKTSVLGDITLNAGDFLIIQTGGAHDKNIYRFEPSSLGSSTGGVGTDPLIQGSDVGITDKLYSIEFLEDDITIGDETISAGQLLLTGDTGATVGNNGLSIVEPDIYLLDVTATTEVAGTAVADATILFDGSDMGFDSSNEWSGLSLSATSPINTEPTLTATSDNPTFNEGGAAAGLYTGSTIDTVESNQTLSGMTLSVTNVADGADEILNIDGSSITLTDSNAGMTTTNSLSYTVDLSGSTATIALSGGALSEAQAQALVDSLSYQNDSVDPTANNRVVTLTQLVDSGGTANSGDDTAALNVVSTVTLQSVNNEPTLTATGSSPTFSEGGSAVGLFSGAAVDTIESSQTVSGITLTVSNVADGADELLIIDGSNLSLINANTGTTVTNGLGYTVSVSGGTATVILGGGTMTAAQTQTMVNALSYQSNSVNPTVANRVVTLTQMVDSGGSANGGEDTVTLSIASTVTIESINNAPTLTATGNDPDFIEGGGAAGLFSGATVSTIESGQTVSGVTLTVSNVTDGADEIITIDGSTIALTSANSGVTATNSLGFAVNVSGSTATLVITGGSLNETQTETLINTLSYQNDSEDPTVANRVVTLTQLVDSGGTANGGNDTATLSIASTLTILPVNDEPTLTAIASNPTFTENGSAVELFSGSIASTIEGGQTISGIVLTVSNVDDNADELLTIDGGTLALTHGNSGATTSGSLNYTVNVSAGTATVALSGGTLSTAQTQSLIDTMKYQNNSADPTTGTRVITLTELLDSGGTSNGGDNAVTLSLASTVTVQSVNAEPTLTTTNSNPTFVEGGGPVGMFTVTLASTVETGQNLTGLTLTISDVTDGADELLIIDGGSVALTNASSGFTTTNSLTYTVNLSGGTATVVLSGGSLSEAQAQTLVDTLSYQNTSEDPTVANRVVTLTQLVDSGGIANGGDDTATLNITSPVAIQSVNDEPTLTTTGIDPVFAEGDIASVLFSGTAVNTIENGQTLSGLTLTVTNVFDGADEVLTIDGSAITLIDASSGSTATNGMAYSVSVAGNTATVILTGGSLSQVQTEALVDALSYHNDSVDLTVADRVVTLTELVDSGGTANAGDNTTSLSAISVVTIQAVNNAPMLTTTGIDPTFTEGGSATGLFSGTTVSSIENGQTIGSMTLTVSNVTDGADELLGIDGSTVALTDANGGITTTNGLSFLVNVSGNTATVVLSGGALSTAQAQVLVDSLGYQNDNLNPTVADRVVTLTQLVDSGGTANGGDNTTALGIASTVAVQSVNNAPTLSTTASNPIFTEGGSAADLFSGSAVNTIESDQTVSGLTLTVSNVADGTDELLTVDGSGIALTDFNAGTTLTNGIVYSVNVSGGTAMVTLTGGALSAVQTQTLIDTLSYQNDSVNPTVANREVTLTQLVDSGGIANGGNDTVILNAMSTVSILSVNAEPLLTTTGINPNFTEGSASVGLYGGTLVSTVESGQQLIGLTLTVSNVTDDVNELLTIDGSTVALTDTNGGTTAANGLTYLVDLSGSTATVVLSGGTLSTAQVQTLVDTLRYQNNSADPTVANRDVTLTQLVDSGGTTNGGDDTAALIAVSTVTVQSVNDEPTLTTISNDPTFVEGAAPVGLYASTLVSAIEVGQTFSGLTLTISNVNDGADEVLSIDNSSVALTNANSGITATNSLGYVVSVSGSTVTVVISGGAMTAAETQILIDSLSYQNDSVNPTLSNRVVALIELIDSGGTSNSGDDTVTLNAESIVTIQSVNAEPTLTTLASNPTFTEGDALVGLYAGTLVTTVESGQQLTGLTLTISNVSDDINELLIIDGSSVALTLANSGVTTTNNLGYSVNLSGTTATVVLTGGTLSAMQTQTLIDTLSYQNDSVNPTVIDRVVTLTQLVDSGGSANGGNDIATLNAVSTISVLSVNNEPMLTTIGSNPTFIEGGSAALLFSGTTVTTIESDQTVESLSLTLSNITDGADELLTIDGGTIALTDANSGSTTSSNLNYQVSLIGETATVVLSGGSLSAVQAQALVDTLSYQNDSVNPTVTNRVVTLTQIVDSGGNSNGGSDTTALNVTSTVSMQSVNAEPTLTTNSTNPEFIEGSIPVQLFSGTLVNTIEAGQTMNGLTLTVSNLSDGADEVLTIDGSSIALTHANSGITATNNLGYLININGSTATVVLSGGALSAAQTQTLIDNISYQNDSTNPTIATRVVTLTQMVDSGGSSNGGDDTATLNTQSTVSVQSVNNAPTLTTTAINPTFTEGGVAIGLYAGTMADVVEFDQTFTGLTLMVSNVSDGANEVLGIDGSSVALTHANSGITTTNNLSYVISLSGNTVTMVLSGGTLSAAQTQTLIDTLSYQNDSADPTAVDRIVTLTQLIDSGGTANGGDDTVNLNTTSTVAMLPVNNQPTLTTVANNPTFTEGEAAVSLYSATTVSTVENSQQLSGLTLTVENVSDGSAEQLSIDGLIVSLSDASSGMTGTNNLAYTVTVNGGTATVILSGGTLSEAQTQTLVNGLSYQNDSVTPTADNRIVTLTQLVDTGGVANGGTDTAVLNTVSVVQISPVNTEQEVVVNTGATISEGDLGSVISGAMLKTSDEDHSSAELIYSLLANPESGSLKLDGVALVVNSTFSQSDIENGALSFDHDDGELPTAGFDFSVDDGIGIASAGRFDIEVISVNDNDPQADDEQIIVLEGGTATELDLLEGQTLLSGDSDVDMPNDVLSINTIAFATPSHGILQLMTDGTFSYTHDGSENFTDSFSYELQDENGGPGDVGHVAISITAENDAPLIQNNQLTISASIGSGQPQVLTTDDLSAQDTDNGSSELQFTVTGVSGGHFELLSAPDAVVTQFSQEQIESGQVVFVSEVGNEVPAFNIAVTDGELNDGPVSADVRIEPGSAAANPESVPPPELAESIATNIDADTMKPEVKVETQEDPQPDELPQEIVLAADLDLVDSNLNSQVSTSFSVGHKVLSTENSTDGSAQNAGEIQVITQRDTTSGDVRLFLLPPIDLNFSPFLSSLDDMSNGINSNNPIRDKAVVSGISISTGLSVGYVIWLIRGGVLLSTMVSSLPAWHLVDPLPIVDRERDENLDDDESLEEIVASKPQNQASNLDRNPNYPEHPDSVNTMDSK